MKTLPIAYFVSSHGFGHAARSAAIMEALYKTEPAARFSVFTGVPEWFFADSMTAPFEYLNCRTDVGLVQATPMVEDLPATLEELSKFLPLRAGAVERAVEEVRRAECRIVVTDISPLGIAVASDLGLPCALVENFTWDWIYSAYLPIESRFTPFIDELQRLYSAASLRIQAQPFCNSVSGAAAVEPVARTVRQSRPQIRKRLGLTDESLVVLVTMGGFPASYRFLDRLSDQPQITFVIPGSARQRERRNNLVLLPHRTGFQHADLVSAADLVVGKLGYSTLAECFQAGTPFLYLQRRSFPESPPLARFARKQMVCGEITEAEFDAASWTSRVYEMSAQRTRAVKGSAGSHQAADLVLDLLATLREAR